MPSANPDEYYWSHEGITSRAGESAQLKASDTGNSGPKDPMEQRRYPRIDLKVPILYRVLSEEPTVASNALAPDIPAKSDNIGARGACLVLAERLPPGTSVALSIHIPDEKQKISAVARVVWSQATDLLHHYLTGLEFVAVYRKTNSGTEYVTASVLQKIFHQ